LFENPKALEKEKDGEKIQKVLWRYIHVLLDRQFHNKKSYLPLTSSTQLVFRDAPHQRVVVSLAETFLANALAQPPAASLLGFTFWLPLTSSTRHPLADAAGRRVVVSLQHI
jgi:hypothetical protein